MRIDKFLKVSRLIKRRTVAKELADQGRILINDSVAKAGSTVKVGDKLSIRFGQKTVVVEVADLKETVKKEEAESLYKVLSETAHPRSED
ncbi:RNA-binding S4 domain-containing protein [Pullulanibacillus sp. KACC 23026]|uniref:RNA-binding S4 domain-containing protein n=1 Tax=Pullulanibacillus sp. KACC 23026 TaxID=3028315 RepID=UPI0023B03290|nr:RNA-binding S4 domain-containing protein [Pullulanibacillus sp. KACC 23026]WEG12723.1 RNA-binding S4 domain-containing protein [Pullulanibacillus sp. KACC 23026]